MTDAPKTTSIIQFPFAGWEVGAGLQQNSWANSTKKTKNQTKKNTKKKKEKTKTKKKD